MKKSNVLIGAIYILAGIAFAIGAMNSDERWVSQLSAFAGAGLFGGAIILWKWFRWNRPHRREEYRQKLEAEEIWLKDERNVKLRDRSGRYAYLVGLLVTSFAMVVFSVLDKVQVAFSGNTIVCYLGGYLVFQYIIGILIYRHLQRKY